MGRHQCSHRTLAINMKLIVFAAILALASAAKLGGPLVSVLRDDSEAPLGANYRTAFELDNGIKVEEVGTPGSVGQSVVRGSYSFISPEGEHITVTYVADENGFQASGPHIPTPPPIPAHALEQIRFAEQQRQQRKN